MAEIDAIVIQRLRSLGCDIGEEIVSIRQFTAELVVDSVSRCIGSINPDIAVPHRLSASVTTKYRQASVVADACKTVGFTGDVGYEAILYGGENEIRKLLVFLVDKLPREEPASIGTAEYGSLFARDVRGSVEREQNRPWLPPHLWMWRRPSSQLPLCINAYRSQRLSVPATSQQASIPAIPAQLESSHDLLSSIIELNSLKLASADQNSLLDDARSGEKRNLNKLINGLSSVIKQSELGDQQAPLVPRKPAIRPKPALPPRKHKTTAAQEIQDTEVEASEKLLTEEEQVAVLKTEIERSTQHLQELNVETNTIGDAVRKAETVIKEGQIFLDSLEKSTQLKRDVSLAAASGNLDPSVLQASLEEMAETLHELGEQWEQTKGSLMKEVNELKHQSFTKENSVEKLKEEIRESKQFISALQGDQSERDKFIEVLRKEHQRLTNNITRTSYTKRILEILANIKKQRVEIDKIIKDTRIIQKEINQLSGRLDRAFTETDELMFRDAKNDEFVRKAYKHVATFHETCAGLIDAVEATGVIMRETKDLEDDVDNESKKDKDSNLKRIMNDLETIKKENMDLLALLK